MTIHDNLLITSSDLSAVLFDISSILLHADKANPKEEPIVVPLIRLKTLHGEYAIADVKFSRFSQFFYKKQARNSKCLLLSAGGDKRVNLWAVSLIKQHALYNVQSLEILSILRKEHKKIERSAISSTELAQIVTKQKEVALGWLKVWNDGGIMCSVLETMAKPVIANLIIDKQKYKEAFLWYRKFQYGEYYKYVTNGLVSLQKELDPITV